MEQSPQTSWILTDGNAGNVRQARALADALGLPSREWTLAPRAPWRWLAPRRLPGATAGFDAELARTLRDPTGLAGVLAIGCGRQAALATRLLREHGARAVQILDPRLRPDHWDLVIAPEHDDLRGDNVIALHGSLHPVDAAWLAQARAAFPALGTHPGPRTTLLLGGASAHGGLDEAGFQGLASRLEVLWGDDGGSVLATASRRTPPAVRARLRERYGAAPHLAWADEADGPNPYPGLLAWADRIVCSADSVNMLSEACATTVPVYVAGLQALRGRPRRFVDHLLASGRVRPLESAGEPWDPAASPPIQALDESARVAALVRARLGLPEPGSRGSQRRDPAWP